MDATLEEINPLKTETMNNLISAFLPLIVFLVIAFAPVALIYKAAESARKNTTYVLLAGIFLGWLGAGIVALILPRMNDEEWAAFQEKIHGKKNRGRTGAAKEWSETSIIFGGLGVMTLICVAFIIFIQVI